MSDKTKVWLLSGMAVALAIGVVWQLIIRKDEFFQSSEPVTHVRLPGADNKRSTSAGRASNPGNESTATKASAPNSYSGSEDSAGSPSAKPNAGIEGDATPPPPKRKNLVKNSVPAPPQPRPAAEGTAATSPGKTGISPQPPITATSSNPPPSDTAAVPKVTPTPTLPAQEPITPEAMLQKAQAALARGDYVSPQDNNALYWARRARRMNPQYQPAIQIEETILFEVTQLIQSDRKAGRYDSALMRLDMMQKLYPNRTQLTQLRSTIQQEQSRGKGTNPR